MKQIIVFAFFPLAQIAKAQNVNIKWSERIGHSKIFYVSNFTAPGDTAFNTTYYENKSEKYRLRHYNRDLQVQSEQELVNGLPGYSFFNHSFGGKSGIYHLMMENSKRTQEGKLVFLKNEKTIAAAKEQNNDALFTAPTWIKPLRLSVSKNGSYVMHFTINYDKKEKSDLCEFEVFNTDEGSISYKGSLNIPALKDKIESYVVDNNGNAYFLIKRGIGFRPKDRVEKPTIELLIFDKSGAQKIIDINPDYYVAPAIDLISDDSGIYIIGLMYFMKTKEKNKADESVFMFNYFDSKKMELSKLNGLVIDGLFPDKKLDDADRLLYQVKKVYYKSNCNTIFVLEQHKSIINNSTGVTSHSFHDIAVLEVNNENRLIHNTRIPKLQVMKDAGDDGSFVSTFKNDTLYLFYSDRQINTEVLSDIETKKTASKNSLNGLFVVKVSGESVKKELLYRYVETTPVPIILKSHEIKTGEILLSGKDRIGLVTILD